VAIQLPTTACWAFCLPPTTYRLPPPPAYLPIPLLCYSCGGVVIRYTYCSATLLTYHLLPAPLPALPPTVGWNMPIFLPAYHSGPALQCNVVSACTRCYRCVVTAYLHNRRSLPPPPRHHHLPALFVDTYSRACSCHLLPLPATAYCYLQIFIYYTAVDVLPRTTTPLTLLRAPAACRS